MIKEACRHNIIDRNGDVWRWVPEICSYHSADHTRELCGPTLLRVYAPFADCPECAS